LSSREETKIGANFFRQPTTAEAKTISTFVAH